MSSTIHPWEAAGLGKAPFRFTGVETKRGPIRTALPDGVVLEVGAPGQPMGSCDYCGQGIADCYGIRSADGKSFVVGCDCVRRVHTSNNKANVLTDVERAARKLRNERASARAEARGKAARKRAKELLENPAVRQALASVPSAHSWAAAQGKTALDDMEYRLKWSGMSGSIKICKELESRFGGAVEAAQ